MTQSYAEAVSRETGGALAEELGQVIDRAKVNVGEALFALAIVTATILNQAKPETRVAVLGRFCMSVAEGMRGE